MNSRYLRRLDAAIEAARDSIEGDCLKAERAIYLARQGNGRAATELVEAIRAGPRARTDFLLSGWLSLAEGLISYFSDLSLSARDKILRAQAFAGSSGLKRLDALCSAWLAQLEFSALRLDSMMSSLRRAFAGAANDHHMARARASLVLAQALHYARRFDLAAPWYKRAHRHATEEGDELTISAIMYNMAWLHMVVLRQAVLQGEPKPANASLAMVGTESMRSFDELIGAQSFKSLDPMLIAQTLSLEGRCEEALKIYSEHLPSLTMAGVGRWRSVLLADRAWCFAQVGNATDATRCAELSAAAVTADLQIDERAATHGHLARTYSALEEETQATIHRGLATESWQLLAEVQSRIVELAGDYSE